ncbi:MAG: hypothetical protein A2508_08735 [Candidatus Lambdaproteobacteria bacterium RIFOXYD12_FULL_49_8]|nr:MAG: hypothetical protein A2508_08735 [Candidatus Lambdaproteobacteria bacterium RIFOXYD12_FULL_49_8]
MTRRRDQRFKQAITQNLIAPVNPKLKRLSFKGDLLVWLVNDTKEEIIIFKRWFGQDPSS